MFGVNRKWIMNKMGLTIGSGDSASLVDLRIPHSGGCWCRTEIRSRWMSGWQGYYGVTNLPSVLHVIRIRTVMTAIEPPSPGINLAWQSFRQLLCPLSIGHRHWLLFYSKICEQTTNSYIHYQNLQIYNLRVLEYSSRVYQFEEKTRLDILILL